MARAEHSVGVAISLSSRTPGGQPPFARGAVSWLRHLSHDQTLYQDGIALDLGGGVDYVWRTKGGHVKPYGLRADVFMNMRSGGIDAAAKSRVIAPAIGLSLIFRM